MTKDADRKDPKPVEKETLKDLEVTDEDEVKGGTDHPTHDGCPATMAPPKLATVDHPQ